MIFYPTGIDFGRGHRYTQCRRFDYKRSDNRNIMII